MSLYKAFKFAFKIMVFFVRYKNIILIIIILLIMNKVNIFVENYAK